MKMAFLFAASMLLYTSGFSQNAGIATMASEKLPMAGTAKTNMRIITTVGNPSDFNGPSIKNRVFSSTMPFPFSAMVQDFVLLQKERGSISQAGIR